MPGTGELFAMTQEDRGSSVHQWPIGPTRKRQTDNEPNCGNSSGKRRPRLASADKAPPERPEIPAYDWGNGYSNVWLGVTCENQRQGVPRLETLRNIPARVRFVSFEPLLEDLGSVNLDGVHWAIIGGETGLSARPMATEWVRSLLDQCRRAGVAPWVKQLGRCPTFGEQPLVLRDKEGHRDSKGADPAAWPSKLHELKVRELPTSNLALGRRNLIVSKGRNDVVRELNQTKEDEQFPLEAYEKVYCWIGRWAEESRDPDHRAVAQAAHDALTVVGNVILETMRRM